MAEFTHLHVHSDFSFLDGAATVNGLAERAAKLGMKSLALTDHGVMCGLMDFKKACGKNGVKPILGSEIYVTSQDIEDDSPIPDGEKGYSHLVLLAKNDTGYKNLTKIVSRAFTEGFKRKPRADYKTLAEHSEGIIALTACLAGEVPQQILRDRPERALEKAKLYADIFGKENFYLEVQNHRDSRCGSLEQKVGGGILKLAKDMDFNCVLTNDSHYLNPEDFYAHNVMLCINTGRLMTDQNRMEYGPDFYLKSADEMAALYPDMPELLTNSMRIEEQCDVKFERDQKYFLPSFECPDGMAEAEYMHKLCMAGLARRYGEPLSKEVTDRYQFERETIEKMQFPSYFLIVQDFINWAKGRGIPVGPGRGSAAGSIVAYALGITDVDPLKYNLLFERFLNPDRISMPDIDIDFCQERRGEVIEYTRNKYGSDCVCQIGTFGKLLSRAALKDVGRVLNVPLATVNSITKQIEVKQGRVPKIAQILKENEALKALYDDDEEIHELFDTAARLEGVNRGTGVHAAGVVIAPSNVANYMPLMRQKEDASGEPVIATQYDMNQVEDQGLLKMDFLGLRNLTIIQKALEFIEADTGRKIDISTLPLEDEETYKTLATGHGFGLFQLESEGMCKLLKNVKPTTFEDISAVLAIYRPGPLSAGVDKQFAKRKSGEEPIYMLGEEEGYASAEAIEKLTPLLSDTYGLLIYQEQAMLMSRHLGGFSPGRADVLRKAIGKKNEALMEELRPEFVAGCEKNGYGAELGEHLWDKMEGFGAYGFNKSHTVAYGLITFQTAWLKTHYPTQYAAALISSQIGNNDKIIEYVRGVRNMGLQVLPPDINLSRAEFTTTEDAVVFGLSGMKGAGTKAIDAIVAARESVGGKFHGFMHFLENCDHAVVGKAVLEALIRGGAFDSFKLTRAALMKNFEKAQRIAAEAAEDKKRGQKNIFGGAAKSLTPDEEHQRDLRVIGTSEEWSEGERQKNEKEAFGFFISSTPLDTWREIIETYRTHTSVSIQEEKANRQVIFGGMLRSIREIKIKKDTSANYGRSMAKIEMQDLDGMVNVTAFPNDYEKWKEKLEVDSVVFLRGFTKDGMDESMDIILAEVIPAEQAEERFKDDPLLKFGGLFKRYSSSTPDDLPSLGENATVRIAGYVSNAAHRRSKNSQKDMLRFSLVNTDGSVNCIAMNGRRGNAFDEGREILKDGAAVVVEGGVLADDRGVTLFVNKVRSFEDAQRTMTKAVCVELMTTQVSRPLLENLREMVEKHQGELPFFLRIKPEVGDQVELVKASERFGISASPAFFAEIEAALGKDVIEVLAN